MKSMSQHTEWLSMVEISGPFLALSVLERIFPQGLESLETHKKKRIRSAYEEWREAVDENDPLLPELHRAWIQLVLDELLELEASVLKPAGSNYIYKSPDGCGQFKPDYVLRADDVATPMFFISTMPEGTDLEKVKVGDSWPVSIFERMTLLCRDKGVRLGLVTNGERWMLVNAPVGSTSSHISWYARLWFQEPVTLKAFQSLFGVRRWFGPADESLPSMLEDSLQDHEEVTDTLGEQVKRAVEVLVQCLDKADQDRNRELLHDVSPAELYEAGLTVMMRLVFVLCAEERGLLLLGDPVYDQHYAITTLRGQLAEEADRHGHEVLERRHDAWSRLLSVFRAVFGGIDFQNHNLAALGGSLFDPDRFPFLEGRAKGTSWRDVAAQPLPIDNRTVLLLLEALQVLERKSGAMLLSYKALDVEQIGQVYEGLLEHTVCRLAKDTLGLSGAQKAKNPNVALAELESARLDSEDSLISVIENITSRSRSAIENALAKEVDDAIFSKIVTVCGGNIELARRIQPFAHLLRTDAWDDFIFYPANSFAVTLGTDRRETGTHYTPKSLTESIVETTLKPVVYIGPSEGKTRDKWQLKTSVELLNLKICDPAMGSGAFLVQVCRWLSERLVEAWGKEAIQGKFITVDGIALDAPGNAEPMPDSLDERLLIARRLIAEKCLYGVDLNPLAVELAKLSIWLITLAKGRPFGFLDHNLKSGDSLLGIHRLKQLYCFDLHADEKTPKKLFADKMDHIVDEALKLRKKLREIKIRDIRDVENMARLDEQARVKLERIELIADAMIGEALLHGGNQRALNAAMDSLSTRAAFYIEGDNETGRKIIAETRKSLSIDFPTGKSPRKPMHWALEFPEVFERGGFHGIVGNPPFMGGKRISSALTSRYREFIISSLANGIKGNADFCTYFFLRNRHLLSKDGCYGMLATNSIAQGDTREVGLDQLEAEDFNIYRAYSSLKWPGKANLHVAIVWSIKGNWSGLCHLDNLLVSEIPTFLSIEVIGDKKPYQLESNKFLSFQGSNIRGRGFILSSEEKQQLIQQNSDNCNVIFSYLTGEDINKSPQQTSDRYVINFFDWDEDKAKGYPEPFRRLQNLVLPERKLIKHKGSREKCVRYFWRYDSQAKKLYETIKGQSEILVTARVSPTCAVAVVKNAYVFYETVIVFNLPVAWGFPLLQSSLHWEWVRQYTGTFGATTNLRYTASDCFETFPIPANTDCIISSGSDYLDYRRQLMLNDNIGLTTLYNRLKDPKESSSGIKTLRELLVALDVAVVAAYGWYDLDLGHGFQETKQGIRFTISEKARREVLQRLLILNHERYEKEVAQGLHDKEKRKGKAPKKAKPGKNGDSGLDLFNVFDDTDDAEGDE